jgi:hypothetical protein
VAAVAVAHSVDKIAAQGRVADHETRTQFSGRLIRAKNFRERRMDTDLINSQIRADFKIH